LELFSLEEKAALLPGGLFVCSRKSPSEKTELPRNVFVSFIRIAGRWVSESGGNMFCDRCGGPVEAGQGFCSKCGKQIIGEVAVFPGAPSRVQQHLHMLGILWLAISALNAVGGVIALVVANTLFPHLHRMGMPPEVPTEFLTTIITIGGILILAKAAVGFIAGWGLIQREAWARVIALVLAFISLFHIPFGTAIGVYTLWVLLPAQSQQEYDALVEAKAA
jgi:hypothetical protein